MNDAREVHGTEHDEARAAAERPILTLPPRWKGNHLVCPQTHVVRVTRATGALVVGWYEVTPLLVLHWTRKADMLQEVGALLAD